MSFSRQPLAALPASYQTHHGRAVRKLTKLLLAEGWPPDDEAWLVEAVREEADRRLGIPGDDSSYAFFAQVLDWRSHVEDGVRAAIGQVRLEETLAASARTIAAYRDGLAAIEATLDELEQPATRPGLAWPRITRHADVYVVNAAGEAVDLVSDAELYHRLELEG